MNPEERVSELEAAGVDPDGFHEDEDAPVPGSHPPPGLVVLNGGLGREPVEEVPADRPSGVYKRTQADRDTRRVIGRPGTEWLVQGPDGEALCLHVRAVGCFLIRPDGYLRHRVFNRLTGFQHITYGSDAEVDVEYLRQAEAWKLKLSPVKKHGSGWRQTNFQKTEPRT